MFEMFHAHVYFEPGQEQQVAALRTRLGHLFPVRLGTVHPSPIGPHTKAMFQILFSQQHFGTLVPWLMQNRHGLDILIHPESGDDILDHTAYQMWLGTPVTLKLEAL